MKRAFSIYSFAILAIFFLFATSCMKDDQNDFHALDANNLSVPVLTTKSVSNITQTGAFCGGSISSDGNSAVTARGVCWSTSAEPTISNSKTIDGAGTGSFSSVITGLALGTNYYVRAYATNSVGTSYGEQITFSTPTVLTLGSNYAGGIIFYIDGTGNHGLVCATTDQSDSVTWGCPGVQLTGADIAAVGGGSQNTTDIITGCTTVGIAAYKCYNLTLNGYNDWFLPSKEELRLMYNNLLLLGLGNFKAKPYWSSTEMTANYAWQFGFDSGIVQGVGKGSFNGVRAVRAF